LIGVGRGEQLQHILGCLLEIGFSGEVWKWCFFREKINFENIDDRSSCRKIAFPASVMLQRRPDVPAGLSMVAEGGGGGRIDVSYNSSS
jgi:hypothetical protein